MYYKDNNIITLYILFYSSYILKPLDVGYFTPLKNTYSLEIKKKVQAGTIYIIKKDFFLIFTAVFQTTIT